MITIAIPKGRLLTDIKDYFDKRGLPFHFSGRELIAESESVHQLGIKSIEQIRWILVKNIDVPIYVANGIASLGIVGSDILNESRHHLFQHISFPFGGAKLCLINREGDLSNELHNGVRIASKYRMASEQYLSHLGISGSVYPLNGSLELAPLLKLAPFIIDIVQTGETLKSNGLKICTEISSTAVWLVSNPAYYKVNYKSVDTLIKVLNNGHTA